MLIRISTNSSMVGRIHFSRRDYCSLNMRVVKLRWLLGNLLLEIPSMLLPIVGRLRRMREGWRVGHRNPILSKRAVMRAVMPMVRPKLMLRRNERSLHYMPVGRCIRSSKIKELNRPLERSLLRMNLN